MIMSTWSVNPINVESVSKDEVDRVFKELLKGKVLPNSMESLNFLFLVTGLTHTDLSHVHRHRSLYSTHQLCSGDRDLRKDNVIIPTSIKKSSFKDRYEKLSLESKQLYADMVDSKEVSLMEARLCLTRNHPYYYYFGSNLKDIIAFINQRKCSMVQSRVDNEIAHKMYDLVCSVIPEFKEVVSLKCDSRCHFITSSLDKNTRIYQPDVTHNKYMEYNKKNFVYDKTRAKMNIPKTIQDE